jgi:AraC family transcriptional regulator, transcriptional activator of pobA
MSKQPFDVESLNKLAKVRCSGADRDYTPTKGLHRHQHHEILIIKKGGGEHIIDYRSYPVLDNQVFFLRPGQVHQFKPSRDAVFFFIAIDKESITLNTAIRLNQFEFFQSFNSGGVVVLDNVDPFIKTIKIIEKELMNPERNNHSIMVASFLTIVLVELQREFLKYRLTIEQNPHSEIVSKFNQLLDDETVLLRFVKEYAKHLYVSPNYLNECIKKETGRPASDWINEKLTLEAKRLLKQTSVSLKQISGQLNFTNVTHFCRFFKKHSGLTPLIFRGKAC